MQMGIALASQVDNRFGRTQRKAGEDFAEALFYKWQLGAEGCHTGILIVVEQSQSLVRLHSSTCDNNSCLPALSAELLRVSAIHSCCKAARLLARLAVHICKMGVSLHMSSLAAGVGVRGPWHGRCHIATAGQGADQDYRGRPQDARE